MQKIPTVVLAFVIGTAITLISLWVGQNNHWLPEQASLQAPLVDQLFNVMVTIGVALFIGVHGVIIYAMIKFRKPDGDETDGSDNDGNIPLEILWTAIPAVIVIGLGVYSVDVYEQMGGFEAGSAGMVSHAHHASPDNRLAMADMSQMSGMSADGASIGAPVPAQQVAMTYGLGSTDADIIVNVTGMQFAWLFEYPDLGITVGELHLPVDRRVRLQMKAVDVIHSFWVPQFRLKQDVIPGEETRLQFVATLPGTYPVFCAELCGSYHGSMRTQTIVHSEADYNEWVKTSQIAAKPSKVPMTVAQLSDEEYLAPYAKEIGLDAKTLPSPPTVSF